MKIVRSDEYLMERPGGVTFEVRLWEDSRAGGPLHALDLWVITGARDVEEVLAWARGASRSGAFEVFVRTVEPGVPANGESQVYPCLLRLYGEPVESGGASRVVVAWREDPSP
ncbi:hypothetical protein [Arthrobacter sp. Y-9]|uniref:hypothetical protein n=1 Tax=Arthrobacter sp. Y-9 TaxID=3039385 RepID=UPI00241E4990|nr:hypothetical protein [Arthrobacter sp. Y-9]WFR84135.1 hypothetical protein P9849_00340 [Arthrobacter sp. Y-9]